MAPAVWFSPLPPLLWAEGAPLPQPPSQGKCSSTIPWPPQNVLQFNVGFCWPQNRTQYFRRGRIMSDNNDNNQQRDIITPLHLLFVIAQNAARARCKLHLQLVSTKTVSTFSAELLLVLWQGVSLPLTSLSPR